MRRLALLALLLTACPQSPPSGTSAGATTGATTSDGTSGSTTDACVRSSDCESGGICVSDYVPDPTGGLGGARGPAICAGPDLCIAALDLTRWCFDHQGCCGDLRCHPGDGVCEPADLGVTTGDLTTGDTDGTGDASTSGSSGSSGDMTSGSSGSAGESTGSTGDGSTSGTTG